MVNHRVKIGYARVSTAEQNLDTQVEYLRSQGVEDRYIFTDKCSGIIPPADRPGLTKALHELRTDDVLVVYKLDRLARRSSLLKDIIQSIMDDHRATIIASDLPALDPSMDHKMRSFILDMMISILSFMSESERDFIRARQRDGIENAKKKGVYTGRKIKYAADSDDPQGRMVYDRIVHLLDQGATIRSIAAQCGVSVSTVHNIKQRDRQS
ncbi:TPA: recombinase family protein [Staphylococcus aureus]|nr:recombinase family protein [Staphylococcus aureus]